MNGLIGLVVLVLDIIAIVDAVKSKMTSGKKILWIILVLIIPVVGMILYFLVGKKK
ncbi:PLDc N-terminal domain-containing protein [Candidatus Omnitrophota bacterium]